MSDLDVNSLIWRMFVSATLGAAVHLGQDYLDNLLSTKNPTQRTIKTNVREYEQRFANLPDDLRMIKLCSDARYQSVTTKAVRRVSILGYDLERIEQNTKRKCQKKYKKIETTKVKHARRPAAQARPKQASSPMSSSPTVEIPYHMRVWIDVEPGEYDKHSFEVSKKMTNCSDMIVLSFEKKTEQLNSKFLHRCLTHNLSLPPYWSIRTWLRYSQREGGLTILEEIKWILHCNTTWRNPATWPSTYSTLEASTARTPSSNQDWFRVEKDVNKGRDGIHRHKQRDHDVTKPRIAVNKQNWETHQNAVYWANLRVAQKKGLTFYQTRSNAIILHNTLPAACIEIVVITNSEEVLYNKMYESLRSPRKVVLKPPWHEERKDTSNTNEKQSGFNSSKHGETCCGSNEGYRIQGLPHSTVEQDHTRKVVVIKLIYQFETHPDREALKADQRQNQAFNPLSEKSKNMIHSMVNVESFKMCEIFTKTRCLHCLTYWTTGIMYCTCGTCLHLTEKTRQMNRDRFDTLSVPLRNKEKRHFHGARHGNTEGQRIYRAAHIAAEKAKKKGYKSILVRFQTCPISESRSSRLDGTKPSAHTMTKLSNEDHTFVCTAEEHKRRENSWVLVLNGQSKNGPMKQREDYAEAIKIKERLYDESGGARPKIHPSRQVRQSSNQPFSRYSEGAERVDPKTGWKLYPSTTSSSPSSSWWQSSEKMVAGIELRWTVNFFFVNNNCKVFRLQAMTIPL